MKKKEELMASEAQVNKEDKKMAVDFSKFDKMVNQDEIQKQMDAAPEFDEVPAGTYVAEIKAMEVKPTKAGDKLLFAVQMQIIKTVDAPKTQDKRYIFFNRVISGNKKTDKWNDGVAIKGVISWINELTGEDDLEFENYSQFAEEVLDIFQDISDAIEVEVIYDPDAFNPIKIKDVYDK